MRKILIIRPQPGAGESAARARELGLEPIVAPLFALSALDWSPLDPAGFDAILLTSAGAARLGGGGLISYLALPCHAVGEGTARAAREAGFTDVRAGPSDGAALRDQARRAGAKSVLHLCGRDHISLDDVTTIPVYAANEAGALPPDAEQALVLVHSPRAAERLATLAGARRAAIRIAAISTQAAEAAGAGWRSIAVAAAPRDEALLVLAAKLCQTEGP